MQFRLVDSSIDNYIFILFIK